MVLVIEPATERPLEMDRSQWICAPPHKALNLLSRLEPLEFKSDRTRLYSNRSIFLLFWCIEIRNCMHKKKSPNQAEHWHALQNGDRNRARAQLPEKRTRSCSRSSFEKRTHSRSRSLAKALFTIYIEFWQKHF